MIMKRRTKTKFEIYQDKRGEWRWRARRVGRIVAEGGEGYRRKSSLMRSLRGFLWSVGDGIEIG